MGLSIYICCSFAHATGKSASFRSFVRVCVACVRVSKGVCVCVCVGWLDQMAVYKKRLSDTVFGKPYRVKILHCRAVPLLQ